MANDGSMASQMEAWIAAQILALPEFPTVDVFEGSNADSGQRLIMELTAKRTPYVMVTFEGDRAIPLEEGEQAYEPVYGIYTVVQHKRGGSGRTGDESYIGTNLARDLIRSALDNKDPQIGAGGFYTDRTIFRGSRVVVERKDAFILRSELVVQESPAA